MTRAQRRLVVAVLTIGGIAAYVFIPPLFRGAPEEEEYVFNFHLNPEAGVGDAEDAFMLLALHDWLSSTEPGLG